MVNQKYLDKAEVLIEALPYIQRFNRKIVVIKYGGSAMLDEELKRNVIKDAVLLKLVGFKPIIVHGGGKAITARLKELNIETKFINGLRVTCEKTIAVVDDVLHNTTNRQLVDGIREAGGKGCQISGKKMLRAERLTSRDKETGAELDIGFVGKVVAVDVNPILDALKYGFIPVIAPLATDFYGQVYNINADMAACDIARSLKARKLVFLSDVPGILRDPHDEKSLISSIKTSEVEGLIAEGVLSGGMLPKIRSSVAALEAGTSEVQMIDGRVPHSLLLEIFTDKGIGTEIVKG